MKLKLELRYVKYLLIAMLSSAATAGLLFPVNPDSSLLMTCLASIFAVPFMSFVVTRLPVFREFYKQDISVFDDRIRTLPEQKAAPAMATLTTGGFIAVCLFLLGVDQLIMPAFCGGIVAGVMSFYYAPQ